MNAKSAFLRAALATIAASAALPAMGAVTTVYKCFDRGLGVLYTDQPCRGEQLDIDAGKADPAALAELQREREALSRAMAQRIADNRRVAVEAPTYYAPPYAEPEVYYPAGWGYYGPYANDRTRNRGPGAGDNRDNRARSSRSVPAVPPNGINNRTFR